MRSGLSESATVFILAWRFSAWWARRRRLYRTACDRQLLLQSKIWHFRASWEASPCRDFFLSRQKLFLAQLQHLIKTRIFLKVLLGEISSPSATSVMVGSVRRDRGGSSLMSSSGNLSAFRAGEVWIARIWAMVARVGVFFKTILAETSPT